MAFSLIITERAEEQLDNIVFYMLDSLRSMKEIAQRYGAKLELSLSDDDSSTAQHRRQEARQAPQR